MNRYKSRIAAITGAGSGIGAELARALARAGCHLALSDIREDALDAVVQEARTYGVNCSAHVVDVANRQAVEQYARDAKSTHGAVHMIFNNAGVALADYVESHSYDDFEHLMNINFWGVVYGTKSFLPLLREVDEAHVINISSVFGLGALPSQAAYNASKFAVRGFTESLKMELAGTHIGVSSVHPGGIKTNIVRNGKISEKSMRMSKQGFEKHFDRIAMTTPQKAASVILKGVAKKKRRILVGADARFADRIIRWFPGSYERILRLEKPIHESWLNTEK
ncbi:MAG: SDR family NAD(P)-dependent oxidoreductase [Gammaproteobacteria bacterium]